jgi:hypothetical protein
MTAVIGLATIRAFDSFVEVSRLASLSLGVPGWRTHRISDV